MCGALTIMIQNMMHNISVLPNLSAVEVSMVLSIMRMAGVIAASNYFCNDEESVKESKYFEHG